MSNEYRAEEPISSTQEIEPSINENTETATSIEEIPIIEHQEDLDTDAVLTTAPWQYKLIALITALTLPSNTIKWPFT